MKRIQQLGCDDEHLRVLIRSNEASAHFRRAAAHLEQCKQCQQRIGEIAADAESWSDAGDLLGSGHEFEREERVAHSGVEGLLQPPSHPEMLGRLGRYEIERVIGQGGMGVVFKAYDSDLNRPVAIKVLAPHLAHSGAARQRFAREGRAAAAVMHEHVVAVHKR